MRAIFRDHVKAVQAVHKKETWLANPKKNFWMTMQLIYYQTPKMECLLAKESRVT